jgi:hypothetical protein
MGCHRGVTVGKTALGFGPERCGVHGCRADIDFRYRKGNDALHHTSSRRHCFGCRRYASIRTGCSYGAPQGGHRLGFGRADQRLSLSRRVTVGREPRRPAYAPKQQALGPWYTNGASAAAGVYDRVNAKDDNLYLWGDISSGIPNTGLTVKAHVGHSNGNKGLGPFATSVSPTGEYWDWLFGADYVIPTTPLTLGVAYVDTDISKRESAYLQPSFSRGQDGTGSIAGGKVLVSLTAAF